MTRRLRTVPGLLLLSSLFGVAPSAIGRPEQSEKVLATRELDVEGVVAEVIQSDRKNGVLSLRIRFRNNGDKPVKLSLVDQQGYVNTYLVSGDTKYPLLKDERGHQVATPRDGGGWLEPTIKARGSWNWWGKFPAPPADRKSYDLHLKVGPPIDDVPIVDKP